MAAPNDKEIEKLVKFRERIKDLKLTEEQQTDFFLVRWIRAREGHLDQAETMLRQSLKWREENKIDEIMDWEQPKIFSSICNLVFLGYDSENSPVVFIPFGSWNLRQVVSIGESENFIKYLDWLFESTVQRMKGKTMTNGCPVTQLVFIVDYDQLSLLTLASVKVASMIMTVVKRFEANHPEVMKAVYLVNAGKVFQVLFSMIKPFLSERTTGKLVFLSSDAKVWKSTLAKAIPADVLPIKYGGASTILE